MYDDQRPYCKISQDTHNAVHKHRKTRLFYVSEKSTTGPEQKNVHALQHHWYGTRNPSHRRIHRHKQTNPVAFCVPESEDQR
jgi:hypothetical protein